MGEIQAKTISKIHGIAIGHDEWLKSYFWLHRNAVFSAKRRRRALSDWNGNTALEFYEETLQDEEGVTEKKKWPEFYWTYCDSLKINIEKVFKWKLNHLSFYSFLPCGTLNSYAFFSASCMWLKGYET